MPRFWRCPACKIVLEHGRKAVKGGGSAPGSTGRCDWCDVEPEAGALRSGRLDLPAVTEPLAQREAASSSWFARLLGRKGLRPTRSLWIKEHEAQVQCAAWFPDGSRIASGCTDVLLSDARNGRTIDRLSLPPDSAEGSSTRVVDGLSISPSGRRLAAVESLSPTVPVWDVGGRKVVRKVRASDTVVSAEFAGSDDRLLVSSSDGVVLLWDLARDAEVLRLKGDLGGHGVACTQDGALAVTDVDNGTLWDLATGEARGHLGASFAGASFSADGRWLALGNIGPELQGRTVSLWHVASGLPAQVYRGHQDSLKSPAISPDGTLLATGGWEGEIRLWTIVDGRELWRCAPGEDLITGLAFSPDGRRLMTTGFGVRVWSLNG